MTERRAGLSAPAAALLVTLCASWAIGQVAMKVGTTGISPIFMAGLRSIIAIPALLLWCRARGIPLWRWDGALGPGLVAGGLFALEFLFLFIGLTMTTASRSVVLLYTAPFWTVLGAHWLVPGDRLTPRKAAGLGLAFLGLLVAFGDGFLAADRISLVGDALALLSGIAWGATTVAIKATRLTRISAERTLFYQLLASTLLAPIALMLGEPGIFDPRPEVLVSLAYQSLGVAFVSYAAWFWLVARHQASALAPFLFLTPVMGVAAGWLMLGDPVTPGLIGAAALVAAGIWVVNRR